MQEEKLKSLMFRHSLFFESIEAAEEGEFAVRKLIPTMEPCNDFLEDGENGRTECRFYTPSIIPYRMIRAIQKGVKYYSLSLNNED